MIDLNTFDFETIHSKMASALGTNKPYQLVSYRMALWRILIDAHSLHTSVEERKELVETLISMGVLNRATFQLDTEEAFWVIR